MSRSLRCAARSAKAALRVFEKQMVCDYDAGRRASAWAEAWHRAQLETAGGGNTPPRGATPPAALEEKCADIEREALSNARADWRGERMVGR